MQDPALPIATAPLHGRVAIIAVSTSRIGLGMDREFGAAGADVAPNGRGKPEEIEATRMELVQFAGVRVASGRLRNSICWVLQHEALRPIQ